MTKKGSECQAEHHVPTHLKAVELGEGTFFSSSLKLMISMRLDSNLPLKAIAHLAAPSAFSGRSAHTAA